MKPMLKPGGLILVGEPYWIEPPPTEAYEAMEIGEDEFASLSGTLARFKSAGLKLVEMVMADQASWDRYECPQWIAVDDFLREHPDYSDAADLREWIDKIQRNYLRYGRRYFGWGVFVLRLMN